MEIFEYVSSIFLITPEFYLFNAPPLQVTQYFIPNIEDQFLTSPTIFFSQHCTVTSFSNLLYVNNNLLQRISVSLFLLADTCANFPSISNLQPNIHYLYIVSPPFEFKQTTNFNWRTFCFVELMSFRIWDNKDDDDWLMIDILRPLLSSW